MKLWVCVGCATKCSQEQRISELPSAAPMECQAPGCKNITNAPRLVRWPDEIHNDTERTPQK